MKLHRVQFGGQSFLGNAEYKDGLLTIKNPVIMLPAKGGWNLNKAYNHEEDSVITVYNPGIVVHQQISARDALYAKYLEVTSGITLAQAIPVQ